MFFPLKYKLVPDSTLVAGTCSETHEICHGGFCFNLTHDNVKIKNPKAQNRELMVFL